MNRFQIYIFTLILLLSTGISIAQDDPVPKTYAVRYKTVKEFTPLVQAMLSNRGQIKASPELNMIVVVDRPAYLRAIDSLFYKFDRPAQQFMINIRLLIGTNDPDAVPTGDSTAMHALLDPMYFYKTYEELDKVFIRTEEKTVTSFDLAEGMFNITIDVDYIPGADSPVRFRTFTLNENARDISGKYLKLIYNTSAEFQEDLLEVLAAFKIKSLGKTLIVLVSASLI